MINYVELIVKNLIRNQQLPNDEQLQLIKKRLSSYQYPIGFLDFSIFSGKLTDKTLEQTIEYIYSFLSLLYNEYYTEEELNICVYIFILSSGLLSDIDMNVLNKLNFILQIEPSNKPEIQYIIDELQYAYITLLFNNNATQIDEKVYTIIEHFKEIEQQHNQFTLELRKQC